MKKVLQRWLAACPLMALAVAGVTGILFAEQDVAAMRLWILPATVGVILMTLMRPNKTLGFASALLGFAALHVTSLDGTWRHPLRLHLLENHGGFDAVVEGSLTPDHAASTPDNPKAICEASRVVLEDGTEWAQPVRLKVSMPSEREFPGAGIYQLSGRLRVPTGKKAPGTFDAVDHALRSGFAAEMRVAKIEKQPGEGSVWTCALLDAAERSRRWISEQLTLDIDDDPRLSGVIRAMALGVADEAQDDIEDAFRDSGTLHVFAVSGLHVAMLGMIAWQVLKVLRLRRGAALGVMVLIVFAYAFITGWRPSAARAALMVAVVFCGPSLDRESGVQNNLGLASLLLLGMDTQQLFMPGFQLSFGVLWAIAALTGVFMSPLARWMELDPFLPVEFATWRHTLALGVRRWLIGNACVSASAWLGSLPFILLHFQAVTPVALIANSVLVPLSIAALAVTCMSILAALVKLGGVQIAINNANWFLAKAMVVSATWFSSLPGANFHLNAHAASHDEKIVWRVLAMPDGGAANHLHSGDEHWLLDTGPEDRFRPVLHRYLRHEGVNKLRGIVLSHNDAAHIGAVEMVRDVFGTPELFCSAREPGPYDSHQTILRRLEDGAALSKWMAGDRFTLGTDASLTCLHPASASRSMRGDDRAMVLLAVLHGWRVLWMSDAGWLTENALRESGQDLRCDVLITSQHATDACGTREFLNAARPRLVIRGSRGFIRDHTPPPDTLAAWCAEREVPLWLTEELGSIALEFSSTLTIKPDAPGLPPVRFEERR
ncbi:MAG: hypothetical protein RIS79_2675 [Verrucomicrobiota bacterium]|jgi:ComEC/Rec2-related protein